MGEGEEEVSGELFFSNIQEKNYWTTGNHFKILLIPNKWWSIKDWKLGISLMKHINLQGFLKDDLIQKPIPKEKTPV